MQGGEDYGAAAVWLKETRYEVERASHIPDYNDEMSTRGCRSYTNNNKSTWQHGIAHSNL